MKSCRARIVGTCLTLWLGCLCPRALTGQDVDPDPTLIRLLTEARALEHARILEGLDGADESLESTTVGPFALYTLPRHSGVATRRLRELWEEWGQALEGAAFPSTAFVVTLRNDVVTGRPDELDAYGRVFRTTRFSRAGGSARAIEQGVESAFLDFLRDGVPERLRPMVGYSALTDRRVARAIFTTPLESARDCRAGIAGQCMRALGLIDTLPEWHGWSTARERREAVADINPGQLSDEQRPVQVRCSNGSDADCDAILGEGWLRRLPTVPFSVRFNLMAYVMERGGEGALVRFSSTPRARGPEAITAAAGAPADSVIVEWVRALGADPEVRIAEDRKDRWGALLWMALLLIPVTRSTRWHSL